MHKHPHFTRLALSSLAVSALVVTTTTITAVASENEAAHHGSNYNLPTTAQQIDHSTPQRDFIADLNGDGWLDRLYGTTREIPSNDPLTLTCEAAYHLGGNRWPSKLRFSLQLTASDDLGVWPGNEDATCPQYSNGIARYSEDVDREIVFYWLDNSYTIPNSWLNFITVELDGTVREYTHGLDTHFNNADLNGDGLTDIEAPLDDETLFIPTLKSGLPGIHSNPYFTAHHASNVAANFNPKAHGEEYLDLNWRADGFERSFIEATYFQLGDSTEVNLDLPRACSPTPVPALERFVRPTAEDVDGDGDIDATFWLNCGDEPTEFIAYNDGTGLTHIEYAFIPVTAPPAPVAVYDLVKVTSNETTTFNPLDNDRHADTARIVNHTAPKHGELRTVNDDPHFEYTAGKYPQYDTIRYTIADEFGRRSSQTIHLSENY